MIYNTEFKAHINRLIQDEIQVSLPCGYMQKFWINSDENEIIEDEDAIKLIETLKKEGIPSR